MKLRAQPMYAPDDGAGSAPPAAPSGDTPLSGETSTPGDSSGGLSFDGLGEMEGYDEIEIADGVADAAAPATPPQGAAPSAPSSPEAQAPAQVPPAPQAAPQAQAPAPAAPPAAAPPASPSPQATGAEAPAPASLPSDPAGMLRALEENRAGVIDSLAASEVFALSADEATALETNPAAAVPRLLARTYYQAVNATLAHINNLVPNMISRHMQLTKAQQENETAFYGKFPALKPDVHGPDVVNFAKIIKQTNPQMGKDDFFAMIGAAVMAKHGLMANAPVAVAPPMQQQTPPPFAPARPGATVHSAPIEESPFAGLGGEWDS
jgi:hypothetical protein